MGLMSNRESENSAAEEAATVNLALAS